MLRNNSPRFLRFRFLVRNQFLHCRSSSTVQSTDAILDIMIHQCKNVMRLVGLQIITEPYDERMPSVPDPVIQLACLDASLAMKPVFSKFQSVIITSGTLSPIDLYPRILNFSPVVCQSLNMTLTRYNPN